MPSQKVVTYRGDLIDVFYHSTCGYATANPEEAFGTVGSRPYLRSVSDRNGDGYYCDMSPHFRWTVEWEEQRLRELLRATLPAVMGIDPADVERITSLRAYANGVSGRVIELRIGVGAGEVPVAAPNIRSILRTPDNRPLGSTAVQFSEDTRGGRTIYRAAGAGWGHGVGMCQWGAIGRSRAGQSYRTILTTYLPGTKVERIY